ncbi:MAG: SDR family NAD(P)-dependent oxidoreductase [Thermoanaerobaculales bacterium]
MSTTSIDPDSDATRAPVAIIGIGCLFPKAFDVNEFWVNIRDGRDCVGDPPASHWRLSDYHDPDPGRPDMTFGRLGAFLDPVDFDPLEFGISPRDLEATDTTQLLGLMVAKEALRDAGYPPDEDGFDRERVSVVLGVTGALELVIPLGARLGHPIWRRALADAGVAPELAEDVVQRISTAYVGWQENSFPGLLGNVAAGRIANRLDLRGTNCVVDAACASSLSALHLAMLELQAGRADMAVAGGFDTFNDIFMYMCFSKTPALSPSGHARPFSAKADGTTLGEGLGVLVLKSLAEAERAGDRIYAVIRGIGSSSDGKGTAVYAPNADGQARALRDAYRAAGVDPRTIGLVEGHGTGTMVGDAIEIEGLMKVFPAPDDESGRPWCALGSVKSMIGHTKAAAGAAGVIKAAMALHHKTLPPTIKVDRPAAVVEAGATPFYVLTEKRPWLRPDNHPRRAGVSAFGFGGSNFHCVLEEYTGPSARPAAWDGRTQIFAFSAQTRDALGDALTTAVAALPERDAGAFAEYRDWQVVRGRAAETRRAFDPSAPFRLALAVERSSVPANRLIHTAHTMLKSERGACWSSPQGIFFGSGARAGVAALFPGQGAQYPGMLCNLATELEVVRDTIAEVDAHWQPGRLSDLIWPHPAFDDQTRQAQADALRATEVAQPAIGAASLAALRALELFGVRFDAVAGHSYGELTALCAAGRLSVDDFFRLSILRGELMGAGAGDLGAMTAVVADHESVHAFLSEHRLELVIANRNAPDQMVLSGPTSEIERAEAIMRSGRWQFKRLDVAAAFHSGAVAEAGEPFGAALEAIEIGKGAIPVYGNTTAKPYPDDSAAARRLLAEQLAKPVDFVGLVSNMMRDGIAHFVEVGPGRQLSGLVTRIVRKHEHAVVAIDASRGASSGLTDLARTLAQLAAVGQPVELEKWDPDALESYETMCRRNPPALTVPISGANLFTPTHAPPAEASPAPAPRPASSTAHPAASVVPAQPASPRPPVGASSLVDSLLRLQEQTAELHRRFLEGQERAIESLQGLIGASGQQVEPVAATAAPGGAGAAGEAMPASASPAIAETLLSIVADTTGYPVEMLELPMGLDADLGIDSIKRVEILSALQAAFPEAPVIGPEHLGELQTLQQIVDFLEVGMVAGGKAGATASPAVAGTLLSIVADTTGYPVKMLELPMGLDADLGIDSIKRVEILSALQAAFPEAPVIGPEHLGELQTLQQIVDFLEAGTGEGTGVTPASTRPDQVQAAVSVDRYAVNLRATELPGEAGAALPPGAAIWVTATADGLSAELVRLLNAVGYTAREVALGGGGPPPEELAGLVLVADGATTDEDIAWFFALVQAAAPRLTTAERAVFAGISRLGGSFGLTGLAAGAPACSGGLAGLVKTAAWEWPSVECRAIDVAVELDDLERTAEQVVRAVLGAPGAVPLELGIHENRIVTPVLEKTSPPQAGSFPFGPGDLVVLSGGARGVTAEVAVAFAAAGGPRLALLGRSPEPVTEPEWLEGLENERAIQQALLDHDDGAPTPRAIQAACRRVLAGREIRANLERIRAAGSQVEYLSVDVDDADAVQRCVAGLRARHGAVHGLVHGAGVLADSLIADKKPADFEAVYRTKVCGLRNLLNALADEPLRAMVLFASSTARFGRKGQADYAVANEVLNKMAQDEARARPGCRALSVNWGPWDGGMVTPTLRALFAQEGIEVIGLEAGARYLVDELSCEASAVEVVVLGAGSALPERSVFPTSPGSAESAASKLGSGVVLERSLEVGSHQFLAAHVLNGKAVLPAAMIIEWLAYAVESAYPELMFTGFEDLRIFKGVRLAPGERIELRVTAGAAEHGPDGLRVPVELFSGADSTANSRATIVLASELPAPEPSAQPPVVAPYGPGIDEVYETLLFHGPLMAGIEVVEGCSEEGIVAEVRSASPPDEWMTDPHASAWINDPLALDCAFQMLVLWTLEHDGRRSLPTRAARFCRFAPFPGDGLRIAARVTCAEANRVVADIEWVDRESRLVARMTGYECVADASLAAAFRARTFDLEATAER